MGQLICYYIIVKRKGKRFRKLKEFSKGSGLQKKLKKSLKKLLTKATKSAILDNVRNRETKTKQNEKEKSYD